MDSANDRDKLPLAFGNTYISGAIECSRVLSGPVALLLCTPCTFVQWLRMAEFLRRSWKNIPAKDKMFRVDFPESLNLRMCVRIFRLCFVMQC